MVVCFFIKLIWEATDYSSSYPLGDDDEWWRSYHIKSSSYYVVDRILDDVIVFPIMCNYMFLIWLRVRSCTGTLIHQNPSEVEVVPVQEIYSCSLNTGISNHALHIQLIVVMPIVCFCILFDVLLNTVVERKLEALQLTSRK